MPRFRLLRRSGAASPDYAIPTPVLTETTSPAGSQMTFTIGVTGSPDGLQWDMQLAGDAGFTVPLAGESAVRDEQRMEALTDLTDDGTGVLFEQSASFQVLTNVPLGATFARVRLGRESDDGLSMVWGSWSNTVSETITTLSASTFSPTAKSLYYDLSNGYLTVTTQLVSVSLPGAVRSNNSRVGKRYAEFTVGNITASNFSYVGIGPSTYPWADPSHTHAPGYPDTPAGAALNRYGGFFVDGVDYGPSINGGAGLGVWVNGTVAMMCFDTATSQIWFGENGSWFGNPSANTGGVTVTGMDKWFAYAALHINNSDALAVTANFGASAFTYSLPTGASAFT